MDNASLFPWAVCSPLSSGPLLEDWEFGDSDGLAIKQCGQMPQRPPDNSDANVEQQKKVKRKQNGQLTYKNNMTALNVVALFCSFSQERWCVKLRSQS